MNPELDQLKPYPFERLKKLLEDAEPPASLPHINLSIGEPRHDPPHFVIEALISHLHQVANYPLTKGRAELREAIVKWLSARFGLPEGALHPDHHVLPVNGTREALFAFAQAVVERAAGAAVLMPNPFYQIYEGAALLAGAEARRREAFRRFGETLGLAFQVWDDYLGIWGDPAKTGKSAADDLIAGKKTLPVLYGLQQPESAFARRWRQGPITPEEAPQVARDLAATGARTFVREQAARLTREALAALDAAQPLPRPGEALKALAQELLGRAM